MTDTTQHILMIFEKISSIPRGSGREAALSSWLQGLAAEHGFACQVDDIGHLIIRVPATPGMESAPTIVLQGHMDMVCEKTPDSSHNFFEDPIRCIVEGDWMHADRTTLGADNGIAIALAMALVEDAALVHPSLELLFTVLEEAGGGANFLKPGFVQGKVLVNLDSEDEGTFVIGCAGGQTTTMHLPLEFQAATQTAAFHLLVTGLHGGHSGLDIDKHFASANKLIARVLNHIQKIAPLSLMSINGGTAHNAISREAQAAFGYPAEFSAAIQQLVTEIGVILNQEYSPVDSQIKLILTEVEPGPAVSQADSAKVLQLLQAMPHGVADMSPTVKGFVETSNNLARVELDSNGLRVITSQRSTVMTRMQELTARITAVALLAGAEVSSSPAYPSWQPDLKSALLTRSVETYQNLFGHAPIVRSLHAGVECGTIGSIYSGMDMISMGVTIENPHSPAERMYIPSIEKVWKYLVSFLQSYK